VPGFKSGQLGLTLRPYAPKPLQRNLTSNDAACDLLAEVHKPLYSFARIFDHVIGRTPGARFTKCDDGGAAKANTYLGTALKGRVKVMHFDDSCDRQCPPPQSPGIRNSRMSGLFCSACQLTVHRRYPCQACCSALAEALAQWRRYGNQAMVRKVIE